MITKAELRVVHKVTTEEDRRDSILSGRQIKTHLRCPRVHTNTHTLFLSELSISWCFGSSDQFPLALQSGFSLNCGFTFPPLGSVYMPFLLICNIWGRGESVVPASLHAKTNRRQMWLVCIRRRNLWLFGDMDVCMVYQWPDICRLRTHRTRCVVC